MVTETRDFCGTLFPEIIPDGTLSVSGCLSAHFYPTYGRRRNSRYFTFTRVIKLVGEFILTYGGIISIAVKNDRGTWGLLSLFRFRLLLWRRWSLFPLPTAGCSRVFLSSPRHTSPHPPAPTPYDEAVRSLQRSVFTNFISFL